MRFGSLLGVVFALSVQACQGARGDDRTEYEPDAESGGSLGDLSFCQTYCERALACGVESDADECARSCHDYQTTQAVGTPFLDAMAPCLSESSCDAVMSGDYNVDCYEEAAAQIKPSTALVEDCKEIEYSNFECGFTADVGACVDGYKIYKAVVIELMLDCARRESCDELVACYQELFG